MNSHGPKLTLIRIGPVPIDFPRDFLFFCGGRKGENEKELIITKIQGKKVVLLEDWIEDCRHLAIGI